MNLIISKYQDYDFYKAFHIPSQFFELDNQLSHFSSQFSE